MCLCRTYMMESDAVFAFFRINMEYKSNFHPLAAGDYYQYSVVCVSSYVLFPFVIISRLIDSF